MAEETIRIHGLRQLRAALKRYDAKASAEIDAAFIKMAQVVSDDARSRFEPYDARSAAGFAPRLRGFGKVVVEQRLRKKTGEHPEYGALQMRRALLPALMSHEKELIVAADVILDRLRREEGF